MCGLELETSNHVRTLANLVRLNPGNLAGIASHGDGHSGHLRRENAIGTWHKQKETGGDSDCCAGYGCSMGDVGYCDVDDEELACSLARLV